VSATPLSVNLGVESLFCWELSFKVNGAPVYTGNFTRQYLTNHKAKFWSAAM